MDFSTRARRLLLCVGAAVIVVPTVVSMAVASAAPGTPAPGTKTWGAQNAPYLNGVICTDPSSHASVPLVSWDLGGRFAPAYLTSGISSLNGTDTGRVPFATTQKRQSTVAFAGPDAAATASLLRIAGNSSDPAVVGEVAELVAEHNGTPTGHGCVATGQGGMSATRAAKLWSRAVDEAGPYTVTVSANRTLIKVGATATVTATVTSSTGKPMPGVGVTFATTSTAISLAQAQAQTGADGTVATTATLVTTSADSAPVTATVSIPATATQVATPGAVAAVVLDAPATFAGNGVVAIHTSADPKLTAALSSGVVAPGTSVTSTVVLSGMFGHAGTLDITTYGPLSLPESGLCDALTADDWARAIRADHQHKLMAASEHRVVVGDNTYRSAPVAISEPGCYTTAATVATTDATPNVERDSGVALGKLSLTAIDTTVTATVAHDGVLAAGQKFTLSVAVAKSHGLTGRLAGTLTGPAATRFGGCAKADYRRASVAARLSGDVPADLGRAVIAEPLPSLGCYRLDAAVTFSTPLGDVSVPVHPATASALVLAPMVVDTTARATSSYAGDPVTADVFITGSQAQPGTLVIDMLRLPDTGVGCRNLDWSHAETVATGTPVETSGDGQYQVTSGTPETPGCYSLVPVLTLTANPTVTAAMKPGYQYGLLQVVEKPAAAAQPIALGVPDRGSVLAATIGIVALLLLTVGGVFAGAYRGRDRDAEVADDRLEPDQRRQPGLPLRPQLPRSAQVISTGHPNA